MNLFRHFLALACDVRASLLHLSQHFNPIIQHILRGRSVARRGTEDLPIPAVIFLVAEPAHELTVLWVAGPMKLCSRRRRRNYNQEEATKHQFPPARNLTI